VLNMVGFPCKHRCCKSHAFMLYFFSKSMFYDVFLFLNVCLFLQLIIIRVEYANLQSIEAVKRVSCVVYEVVSANSVGP